MAREPAHNAVCDRCGGFVIVGMTDDASVTLDAAEQPDGAWTAWNRGDVWIAKPYGTYQHFAGLRRREHVCVIPDVQLQIGAA